MTENEREGKKQDDSSPKLLRVLRLGDVISIAVGGTIGSGIFIVPATVAMQVHSPALIFVVWIASGLLCYFGALSLI